MTKSRFTSSDIANALFDKITVTIPPMLTPYGFGMPNMAYIQTQHEALPSLEEACETLHDKGMSKDDILTLTHTLRSYLLTALPKEIPNDAQNLSIILTSAPAQYLGLRLGAPLTPLSQRQDISSLKSGFQQTLQTLMDQKPALFTKRTQQERRYGHRNFGLTPR